METYLEEDEVEVEEVKLDSLSLKTNLEEKSIDMCS